MTEEWVKACLSNIASFQFDSLDEAIRQTDGVFLLSKESKHSIKQSFRKEPPHSFYELLDCLCLSSLIRLLSEVRDPSLISEEAHRLSNNKNMIESLRNSVFHGKFLFGHLHGGTRLLDALSAFSDSLLMAFLHE
jgi:hypothetical protein